MTDPEKPESADGSEVHCRRIHRKLPVAEHLRCSYCFGKLEDVESAEHERFCDFCEGKDPITFGFPET